MKLLKDVSTRSLSVKENGRSGDTTSANFIFGCPGSCLYCYCKRYKSNEIRVYDLNSVNAIIENIHSWADKQPWPKVANQVHETLYLVDIGNACDIPLQFKQQDWKYIISEICKHEKLGITFATTYPSVNFDLWSSVIQESSQGKCRVRVTFMPQKYSVVTEPNGEEIESRIERVNDLIQLGWETHYSFAPIIYSEDWEEQYSSLFEMLPDQGACECIFLTTTLKHKTIPYLFEEELMEWKQSTHGGNVIRYQWQLKNHMIEHFRTMMQSYLPNCKIRYIF